MTAHRSLIRAVLLAFALLLPATTARAVGEAAADFTLKDLKGQNVRLSDHLDQKEVVVISFWATWCQPCQAEMPHLEALYQELRSRGLTVLSINTDEARNTALVRSIVQQKKFTFPVLLDSNTQVLAQYNPRGMIPFTLVLGRDGRVKATHAGYTPGDEAGLRKEVEEALGPVAAAPDAPSPVPN